MVPVLANNDNNTTTTVVNEGAADAMINTIKPRFANSISKNIYYEKLILLKNGVTMDDCWIRTPHGTIRQIPFQVYYPSSAPDNVLPLQQYHCTSP